jgi:hypothetical protein
MGLKKKIRTTTGIFPEAALMTIFFTALSLTAVAVDPTGISMDSASAESMDETDQRNLLAITDPVTSRDAAAAEPETAAPELNKFTAGAFDNPGKCAGCHEDIYNAWSGSMHRFAWENEFYQPDYLNASRETEGFTDVFCGECHAPVARRTRQLPPPDGSLFDAGSRKGVSCDYCHTVKEVVKPVNVETISDPGPVKRGPRGDGESPYHEVEFSKIHTDAAFCGACHNVVHPVTGAVVIDTYDDWKGGIYAREGIRCQDCHMTPGPGVARNPGQSSFMGEDREHVATHFFPGGSVFFHERAENEEMAKLSRQFLEAAAELEMKAGWTNTGIALTARVKNVGAGHKIPTGVTYIRKMWLEVTVSDDNGETVYRSGHITDTNHVDPGAVMYRKMFRDVDGNLTPKSWLAKEIAYDRRVPAKGYDEHTYEIPVPGNGPYHAVVRLMYRSMSQKMAEDTGIEGIRVPSIEMTRAELKIAR